MSVERHRNGKRYSPGILTPGRELPYIVMPKKCLRVQLPLPIRGYADYDYLHELNESELAFMRNFTNKYYRAQFYAADSADEWSREEKRKSYSRKNAGNRDVWSRSVDLTESVEPGDDSWED